MESDDDYGLFSAPEEASPPIHQRKLKRLKKAAVVSNAPLSQPMDQSPSMSDSDSLNGVDLESSKTSDLGTSVDPTRSSLESERLDDQSESVSGLGGFSVDQDRSESLRTLDVEGEESRFGALDAEIEEFGRKGEDMHEDLGEEKGEELVELRTEKPLKKRRSSKGADQNKNKKVKSVGDDKKSEASARTKRKQEKEREAQLGMLHAESQKLLRETRDAAFKPAPVVQKSISSVLEKIRQRKLEVSKKEPMMGPYPKHFKSDERGNDKKEERGTDVHSANIERSLNSAYVDKDSNLTTLLGQCEDILSNTGMAVHPVNVESSLVVAHVDSDATTLSGQCENVLPNTGTAMHIANAESSLVAAHVDESSISATLSDQCENILPNTALDEESKHVFRTPINDTEDLFCDSQPSDGEDGQLKVQPDSPLEEVLAPSVLTMNLKLDSAPADDFSDDDDDDDDKENLDPHPHKQVDLGLSPKGDPVKAFLDDEAEVEDDSDNDLMRFQENEEDGYNEEAEELNDLIATGYEEKPIDSEIRDQLHQKWLEQQDAAATDNVLQRLKGGWKQREPAMLEEEEEDEEFSEYSLDEYADVLLPTNVARMNSKKVKQMIPQMFTDKDDIFLSSDDEETEKRLHKQRVLEKTEDQISFLSPAEDESSREVFGLIKKLNIAHETKKKPKSSSFLDMLITGGNSNSSSKSSFLGRASNNSLASSHKHGSSTVRSFIFGRDDSNSRSGISTSEVSPDMDPKENHSTRKAPAKFNSSQSKSTWQNTKTANEKISGSSLFEILRRSSMESDHITRNVVGQTQTVFAAFKSGKTAIKIEGRR